MSALATQSQLVTVTLGWREPNGQVVQFGGGAGSASPLVLPAGSPGSSSFSSSSDQGSPGGSNIIDLFA